MLAKQKQGGQLGKGALSGGNGEDAIVREGKGNLIEPR